MAVYYKPRSPIQSGEDFIYPLTTADQIILRDGSRLEKNGQISINGTAADSSKLGGKSPEYYATAQSVSALKGEKANKADVLSLEEIQASTDLSGKIASASSVKSINTRFSSLYSYSITTNGNKNIKLGVTNIKTLNIFYFGALNTAVGFIIGHFYKSGDSISENDVYKFVYGSIEKITATVSDDNKYIIIPFGTSWSIGTLITNTPITVDYV